MRSSPRRSIPGRLWWRSALSRSAHFVRNMISLASCGGGRHRPDRSPCPAGRHRRCCRADHAGAVYWRNRHRRPRAGAVSRTTATLGGGRARSRAPTSHRGRTERRHDGARLTPVSTNGLLRHRSVSARPHAILLPACRSPPTVASHGGPSGRSPAQHQRNRRADCQGPCRPSDPSVPPAPSSRSCAASGSDRMSC